MTAPDWLTVDEVAERLARKPGVIRTRCRERDRDDAIPEHLLDRSGASYRIHRSYVEPAIPHSCSNIRELRPADQSRIQRLVDANKQLRSDLLESQIEIARLKSALEEERELREIAS